MVNLSRLLLFIDYRTKSDATSAEILCANSSQAKRRVERKNNIFRWRDERHFGQRLTFSYERKRIMLEESEVSRGLVGRYVDTQAWPDGQFEACGKGFSLPCRVFDPDQQRVTHAAITENKHLSAPDIWGLRPARSCSDSARRQFYFADQTTNKLGDNNDPTPSALRRNVTRGS